MDHPLFHNTCISLNIGIKAVYYRNNTNLNKQDTSIANQSRNLWDLDLDENLMEQRRLEELAKRFTAHSKERQEHNLQQILNVLTEQKTGYLPIESSAELNTHLKYYEGDNFEREIGNWLRDQRKHIVNYAYSIVKAMVEHNHTTPLALKIIKRFAIRLGLTQYTSHL